MRKPEIDHLLSSILFCYPELSDINLTVSRPLQAVRNGQLVSAKVKPPLERLTPFQTETIALNLLDGDRRLLQSLVDTGSCDSAYQLEQARFRVNIFSQRGHYSLVLRQLAAKVPTLLGLGMPPAFKLMAQELTGLILVTGATGSGKSASLAALINEINQDRAAHILTLEDPIEFVHQSLKSTVNQRELGTDFNTFASGLRAALRQAPNVILVGEIRDRETMELALCASETGHLVLATLHSVDAGQTIGRIVGLFDKEEEKQVRLRLADTLRWIVGRRLLPRLGGGRVAISDILRNNIRSRESILMGESEGKTFYEIQEQSQTTYHMITFDQSIAALFEGGLIDEETALAHATRKAVVGRSIDRIKQVRGLQATQQEEMRLDHEYARSLKNRR